MPTKRDPSPASILNQAVRESRIRRWMSDTTGRYVVWFVADGRETHSIVRGGEVAQFLAMEPERRRK